MNLKTKQTITSLEIAELTGKKHFHIMRDIKILIDHLINNGIIYQSKFGLVKYNDDRGKPRPMYLLSRDGANLLVSRYNDIELNNKIAERLDFLEQQHVTIPSGFVMPKARELALIILKLTNQITSLETQLEIVAPKVEYAEKVLTSSSGIRTTQIAKELGMTAQKLNQILKDQGVQFKRNGQWILTARYQNAHYTQTITVPVQKSSGETFTPHMTVWTEKGRKFIHSLLNVKLQKSLLFKSDEHTSNV